MKPLSCTQIAGLVLILTAGTGGLPAAQPAALVRIVSLEPTVLFPKKEPLAQIARLTVDNRSSAAVSGEVVVTVGGGVPGAGQPVKLGPNQSTYDVLIPDVATPTEVRIEVRAAGAVLATHTEKWQPQRKWRIFIVKSSHEDIGYENFIFKKQHDIANFVDLGRELSSPKSVAGNIEAAVQKRLAFHYTMETILFQRNYLEERGERAWREVIEHDRNGRLVNFFDIPGLVNEISALLEQPDERQRLGANARAFARENYDLKRVCLPRQIAWLEGLVS
jgi:hypothetical protein